MLKLPRFSIHAGSTFSRRLRIVTKRLGHAIKKDKKIKIKKILLSTTNQYFEKSYPTNYFYFYLHFDFNGAAFGAYGLMAAPNSMGWYLINQLKRKDCEGGRD